MTQLSITYVTETPSTLIRSSRWNQNFNDIKNFINGNNLDSTDNIKLLGITDASLQTITTAGKVNLSAVVITSQAQGDIIYASSTTVLTRLAKNTTATRYLSNTGTDNNPAWAQVNIANGLTIASQATGDLIYASSATVFARLGIGSTNQILTVTGGVPVWANNPGPSAVTLFFPFEGTEILNLDNALLGFDQSPPRTTITATSLTVANLIIGKKGYYFFDFDGAADFLTLGSNQTLHDNGSAFTYEFWVNLDSVGGTQKIYTASNGATEVIRFYISGTDIIYFADLVTTDHTNTQAHGMSTSTWYYLVITFNLATFTSQMYKNGAALGSATTIGAGAFNAAIDTVHLCCDGAGASDFVNGRVGGFRVSHRILSATEILDRYNGIN